MDKDLPPNRDYHFLMRLFGKLIPISTGLLTVCLIVALYGLWYDTPLLSPFSDPDSVREDPRPPVQGTACPVRAEEPNVFKLRYHNIHWQVVDAPTTIASDPKSSVPLYLYSAHYDGRLSWAPTIKILATSFNHSAVNTRTWWCQLWFPKTRGQVRSVLVPVTDYFILTTEHPGIYHPAIITCPMARKAVASGQMPRAVSLQSSDICSTPQDGPTNMLQVVYQDKRTSKNPGGNFSIGICVQALRFGAYEISTRLVEWLEMIRLLGGTAVHLYSLSLTPAMARVLNHYSAEGFLTWRATSLPGSQPNHPALYNLWAFQLGPLFWPQERLELNDCYYRHLGEHDFILIIDLDEIVVPRAPLTDWQQLLKSVTSRFTYRSGLTKGVVAIRHGKVCEGREVGKVEEDPKDGPRQIPTYLYMQRHPFRRPVSPPGYNIKSFHATDLVTAVSNHFPVRCFAASCHYVELEEDDEAILLHFRRTHLADEILTTPEQLEAMCPVRDVAIWRYFHAIEAHVRGKLVDIFGVVSKSKD